MAQSGYESNKIARVQLYLYASKLKNVAGIFHGVSDPYCIVTRLANNPTEKPKILGKTEAINNTLDPKWTATFLLDFEFGVPLRINVGIYDDTRKGTNSKPMGSALFEIGEVLAAPGNTKAKSLKHGGTLFARVVKAQEVDSGTLNLLLRGIQLKNVEGMFGKSDPFYEVSAQVKSAGGLAWQPVYRSEHVLNDLNPKWQRAAISINTLCAGDKNKPILVTVKDWERNGRHHPMGSFETTLNGILAPQSTGSGNGGGADSTAKSFSVRHKGKSYGTIVVAEASIVGGHDNPESHALSPSFSQALDTTPAFSAFTGTDDSQYTPPAYYDDDRPIDILQPPVMIADTPLPPPMAPPTVPPPAPPPARPQFIDYISGGCELQMCVAIDFTGSNGDPRRPGTLHYIHPDGQLNDYEKAITAVGSIIARYDSDQKFPVWGFGAKFGGVIQHCFQVGPRAELDGIRGVLEGYRKVFKSGLTMSGPTVFAEVIDVAAAQARSKQDIASAIGKQSYTVLLILTDGAVSDINLTKQAIATACSAPLSIVIVGIGNEDFSAMQFLDNFGESISRDICQFVQFSRYQYNKADLTRETLAEIPDQLVDYYYSRGIKPLPPISGSALIIVPDAYNDDEDIDLTIEELENGEVSLAQETGTVYDDTQYGTLSDHMPSASPPPGRPINMVPPASQMSHSYGPTGLTAVAGGNYVSNSPTVQSQHYLYQQSPGGSYNAGRPLHPSSVTPTPNPYHPGGGGTQASHLHQHQHPSGGFSASATSSRIFNVQIPPGMGPGQQLRVQNPVTQQLLIVTIPHGVPPGGIFAVQY